MVRHSAGKCQPAWPSGKTLGEEDEINVPMAFSVFRDGGRSVGKRKDPGSVGRLGLVVRRSVGECEPAWPSGKALGW